MRPQEKAQELVNKFQFETKESEVLNRIIIGDISVKFSKHMAKKSALIAVDEIMKAPFENSYIELVPDDAPDSDWYWDKFKEYWEQVKQEIEKL